MTIKRALSVAGLAVVCLLTAAQARAGQSVTISGDVGAREIREMPKGSGLILGRVLEAESRRPVAGAMVFLTLTGSTGPEPAFTTDQGHFVFRQLPAGSFLLRASKPGWVGGAFGKRRPDEEPGTDARPLVLRDAERLGDVVILMWKYAAIEGQLVDEAGEPMVNVSVRTLRRTIIGARLRYELALGSAPGRTDDRGRYRIATLIPGDYVVAVPAIVGTRSLRAASGPNPPSLAESMSGAGRLAGGPSISGSRVDVGDEEYAILTGSSLSAVPGYAGRTKDGRLLAYETLFHPSVNRIGRAELVTLRSGEERTGIDFQMRPVPTARISGTVVSPDGNPGELMLRLVSLDMQAISMDAEIAQAVCTADGRFTFLGVPPGDYAIRIARLPRSQSTADLDRATTVQTAAGSTSLIVGGARTLLPMTPTLFADAPVSVGDGDITGVSVALRPGARVDGRIQFIGMTPPPSLDRGVSVYVERADGTDPANISLMLGRADRSGSFNTYGLPPGRYFIRMPYTSFPGWTFASAMLNGRDVSVVPLELSDADVHGVVLTFTDAPPNELSGAVTTDRGPNPDASVVVFPADPALWTETGRRPRNLRLVGVDSSGRYRITALPPGDYYVAAIADAQPTWADPRTLETLARTAARVRIAEGEKRTQQLTITRRTPAPDPDVDSQTLTDARGHGPWAGDDDGQVPPPAPPPPPPPPPQAPAREAASTVPKVGTGLIAGIVLTAGQPPQPARRAQVTINGAAIGGSRSVITDETGRFQFGRLPEGRYGLSATKPAYLSATYGAARPGRPGTSITLAAGQQIAELSLTLVRGGVIAGVVRTETGEPVSEAMVQALTYLFASGERRLVSRSGLGERTDDRGAYRLFGLEPGEYLVGVVQRSITNARVITQSDLQQAARELRGDAAAPPPDRRERSRTATAAPVFHPGTTDVDAAAWISIGPGEERTGVDVVMRLVPTARIEGVVSSSTGPLPPNVEVRLASFSRHSGFAGSFDINLVLPMRPDAEGRFQFTGVPPGQYAVVATTRAASGRGSAAGGSTGLWATSEIAVSGEDVSGVSLTLQPGMTVSGRVQFDASALAPPALSGIRVTLGPVLTGTQVAAGQLTIQTDAGGAFTLTGVMPGRYTVRATPPAGTTGWLLRTVALGGRAIADETIDVRGGDDLSGVTMTFTDRPAELSGVLQDTTGRPAPDYYIILFPADPLQWRSGARRIQQARPATDGRFQLRNLLPGEYHLAAVTDVESGEWFDPEFLKTLVSASITLTIAEGEKKVQDVRIAK